ncbi:WYL domain-containing protein [Paenibacillaceae bacterium]|nr:WYL domain-containing protein [Paenibacillaceae bacterium]
MSNVHRIQWFDMQIRQGKYPNSSQLAEHFEISRRQAQRDIEYLEMSLGAPLVYIAKRRGYDYEDQAFILPLLYMTEEEQKVLQYLAYRYKNYNYDNAEAVQRVGNLLGRFAADQAADMLIDHSPRELPAFHIRPNHLQYVEMLNHAIRERRAVSAIYQEDADHALELLLYPLRLTAYFHGDYLSAYCTASGKQRSLRLDGIVQLTVTEQHYEEALPQMLARPVQQPARKPYTAKVQLAKPLTGKAWGGFSVQLFEQQIYTVAFYDIDVFLKHLLVAEWEQLLSPNWLIEKLQARCERLLDRMGKQAAP